MGRDDRTLADLVEFARLEVASGDIEPWAQVIAAMLRPDVAGDAVVDVEGALWLAALYNTTDDLHSSLTIRDVCPAPGLWPGVGPDGRATVAGVRLSTERRNLYGGRILRRMDSYAHRLSGSTQTQWINDVILYRSPQANFLHLMSWVRQVWGVGRLSAFEWCEFMHKVAGVPVETTDGCLWESSGPRESLERLYGVERAPSVSWLTDRAHETRALLSAGGVSLSWWDFETVICDFNVMRKGRYYPGKHLAMISEEITTLPDDSHRAAFTAAYRAVIPQGWRDVPPGLDRDLLRAYATTGRIRVPSLMEV